jgi:hypothetical protein
MESLTKLYQYEKKDVEIEISDHALRQGTGNIHANHQKNNIAKRSRRKCTNIQEMSLRNLMSFQNVKENEKLK